MRRDGSLQVAAVGGNSKRVYLSWKLPLPTTWPSITISVRDGANEGKAADAIGFIEEECRSREDPATRCS